MAKRKTKTKAEQKAKKQQFTQKLNRQKNVDIKFANFQNEYAKAKANARKIFEIYQAKPEILSVIDDVPGLNDEIIEVDENGNVKYINGDILIPVNEKEKPISAEFFNTILKQIHDNANKTHTIDNLLVENNDGTTSLQTGLTVDVPSAEVIEDDKK